MGWTKRPNPGATGRREAIEGVEPTEQENQAKTTTSFHFTSLVLGPSSQLAWPAGMDPLLALACLGMGRVLRGTSHKNRNRLALITITTTTRCRSRRRCAELYYSMQISPLFWSFFVCQTSDLNGSRTPRPTRPQTTSEVVTPLLCLAVGTSLLTLVKRSEPGRLLQLQPNMARRWP